MLREGRDPVVVVYRVNGVERRVERSDALRETLIKKGISYSETNLRTELKAKGIGVDWVDAYARRLKE
jgi:hypothetical protein